MTRGDTSISIDELIRRIRSEAVRRTGRKSDAALESAGQPVAGVTAIPAMDRLPRWPSEEVPLDVKPAYDKRDFLRFHDDAFVRNAYRGILKRQADDEGLRHFLSRLRSGQWNKVDVLGRLRYSQEGRAKAVPVAGLFGSFALRSLFRVPVVGALAACVYGVVRAPRVFADMDRFKWMVEQRLDELGNRGNALVDAAEHSLNQLNQLIANTCTSIATAHEQLAQKADAASVARVERDLVAFRQDTPRTADLARIRDNVSRNETALARIDGKLAEATRRADDAAKDLRGALQAIERRVLDHTRGIADQHRRLALLLDTPREPVSTGEPVISRLRIDEEREHLLDAFYASFEEHFRGTREVVRDRVSVYLDVVRRAGAGTPDTPVVDVACGRGEWLELLRDEGLAAMGVDLNRVMVTRCRELGLRVEEEDLLAHLRRLPAESAGAVTGFHIVEHLPLEELLAVLDETLRVLRPNGVAIFETPNPENLIVGSCAFYHDPTHRNPIPPATMKFIMDARGFSSVEIMRLHPMDIPAERDGRQTFVRRLLAAAQDYAVIGVKGVVESANVGSDV